MIRILMVDDHPIVREGLKQILSDEDDIAVVEEASSAQEALERAQESKHDLILLDISMPGRPGLEVVKNLKHDHPKLPILVLSAHSEEEYGARSLKAGASGYLTKASAPCQLISAIRKVASGRRFVSESLGEWLASYLDRDSSKPLHDTLSDREFLVLRMISAGKTVKEIAGELSLSTKTITTYRARLLVKMRMRTNADLMQYGLSNHLLD